MKKVNPQFQKAVRIFAEKNKSFGYTKRAEYNTQIPGGVLVGKPKGISTEEKDEERLKFTNELVERAYRRSQSISTESVRERVRAKNLPHVQSIPTKVDVAVTPTLYTISNSPAELPEDPVDVRALMYVVGIWAALPMAFLVPLLILILSFDSLTGNQVFFYIAASGVYYTCSVGMWFLIQDENPEGSPVEYVVWALGWPVTLVMWAWRESVSMYYRRLLK